MAERLGGLGDEPRRAARARRSAPRRRTRRLVGAEASARNASAPEPLGAAIRVGDRRAERLFHQLLEPPDLLRLAAQVIVEAQHLGDQPGRS